MHGPIACIEDAVPFPASQRFSTQTLLHSGAGCPVCLCSALEVAAAPCGHGLCLDCAQHLSSADEGGAAGGTPLLCPLCRGVVAGFSLTG